MKSDPVVSVGNPLYLYRYTLRKVRQNLREGGIDYVRTDAAPVRDFDDISRGRGDAAVQTN